ncbi:hypothetical protein ACCO45_013595 [Purpureocillium lilacinum]|uniref:Uncharacterized protein n=1 Tax=Purpureocillium lilacinum TaxID=33203 RepID=A0ACC4D9D5_PURLI
MLHATVFDCCVGGVTTRLGDSILQAGHVSKRQMSRIKCFLELPHPYACIRTVYVMAGYSTGLGRDTPVRAVGSVYMHGDGASQVWQGLSSAPHRRERTEVGPNAK